MTENCAAARRRCGSSRAQAERLHPGPEPGAALRVCTAEAPVELASSLSIAFLVVLERFVQAVVTQYKVALLSLLAQDATWTSDGGGEASHEINRCTVLRSEAIQEP